MQRHRYWILALVAVLAAPMAQAGRHYCSNARGEVVVSDTPCQSSDATSSDNAKPASPDLPRVNGSLLNDATAPRDPHLPYMNRRCRSLYENLLSLRTSRGLTWQQKQTAEANYRAECSDDEQEARGQYYKQQQEQRQAKRDAAQQQRETEQQRSQAEAMSREQCIESRRIIATRRARTDLSPSEQDELARFEERIKQRCQPSSFAR